MNLVSGLLGFAFDCAFPCDGLDEMGDSLGLKIRIIIFLWKILDIYLVLLLS